MMEKRRFSKLHLLLAGVVGALLALFVLCIALWLAVGPRGLTLLEAWGAVQTRFVGEYDPDQALDTTLQGLVAGIGDRWSYYLDAQGYAAQNQRRTNTYVGIGVTVSYEDERGLLILTVQDSGPAAGAGLSEGELIVAVDGFSLEGEARYEGVDHISGEAGTSLTLTVCARTGEERQVTLERGTVETDPVHSQLLDNGVGYIKLDNFYSNSAERVTQAAHELAGAGAKALVFDMRNNGGGYVGELTQMLDNLLPEGPIFRTWSKGGREEVVESDENYVNLPMATLVNAGTYSAAEFFAAQLQESVGAPIVGEETSGKGFSQQAIPLFNGGALNLSTGRYATGAGVSLVGTGVRLDEELSLTQEKNELLNEGKLSLEEDDQFQKALELLGY